MAIDAPVFLSGLKTLIREKRVNTPNFDLDPETKGEWFQYLYPRMTNETFIQACEKLAVSMDRFPNREQILQAGSPDYEAEAELQWMEITRNWSRGRYTATTYAAAESSRPGGLIAIGQSKEYDLPFIKRDFIKNYIFLSADSQTRSEILKTTELPPICFTDKEIGSINAEVKRQLGPNPVKEKVGRYTPEEIQLEKEYLSKSGPLRKQLQEELLQRLTNERDERVQEAIAQPSELKRQLEEAKRQLSGSTGGQLVCQ
jgi:hypothetical protein